eukprot:snap_masked-scaffold_1-processed-gene-5.15-mRNA-1 protein AED:1.00 eAED:1.00 QI:0/0/0/0/1/1/2/0/120
MEHFLYVSIGPYLTSNTNNKRIHTEQEMNVLHKKERKLDGEERRIQSTNSISDEIAQMDQLVIKGMLERKKNERKIKQQVEANLEENNILSFKSTETFNHLRGGVDEIQDQFSRSNKKAK